MSLLEKINNDISQPIICNDAKALMTDNSYSEKKKNNLIPNNSVQFVITSPPYSGRKIYSFDKPKYGLARLLFSI